MERPGLVAKEIRWMLAATRRPARPGPAPARAGATR